MRFCGLYYTDVWPFINNSPVNGEKVIFACPENSFDPPRGWSFLLGVVGYEEGE